MRTRPLPPHLRPNAATAQILRRRFIVSDYHECTDIPFIWDIESFCQFYGLSPTGENIEESIVNYIMANRLDPEDYLYHKALHSRSPSIEPSTNPLVVESHDNDFVNYIPDMTGLIFRTTGEVDPLRILERIESHNPNREQPDILDPLNTTLLEDIYTILNELYPPSGEPTSDGTDSIVLTPDETPAFSDGTDSIMLTPDETPATSDGTDSITLTPDETPTTSDTPDKTPAASDDTDSITLTPDETPTISDNIDLITLLPEETTTSP